MVTHKVDSDLSRVEGGGHLIGFLEPCLHRRRALVFGPEKDVGITVLAGRELVDLLGGTPYRGANSCDGGRMGDGQRKLFLLARSQQEQKW